ncbi:Hsp20/alpha crystallin family protein [Salipiger aestuarii]|uniref:Hsp20/alpha crystallin family protein n=1 Tax=Salipiger aestuarii TaxID=568098 RepID=UPI001CC29129|nr:Hsp20/alpha crystallin family protein [Salipiger aestuarii]
MFEEDDGVTLMMDIPGVAPDSVDVSVENRALTVHGTNNAPAPEGYRRIYAEYAPAAFERAFSLPDTLDADGIEASHRDGVLVLTFKKGEAATPKQIKVKAAKGARTNRRTGERNNGTQ